MATATARNVDDDEYDMLTEIAEENDRSVSAELREMISERVKKHKIAKILADMRAFVERNPLKLPDGMTSLDLLREERDSW